MAEPCETCLRWPECNGVDRNTCPLHEAEKELDALLAIMEKENSGLLEEG